MADNAITLHGHRFYMEESDEDRRVRLAEEYEVILRTAPKAVEWRPQTDSPLEILRPAWDLWTLGYRLWAVFFAGCARYCDQKADMLRWSQNDYDAGGTGRWWS